jgi:hypothetical protein
MPLPRGNRVSFLAPSGAMLVVLSDLCVRLGLEVPDLEAETVQRLHEINPPFDFLVEMAGKYPKKPLLVTFSGDKRFEEECKDFIEPLGLPSFPETEQPFEVLSILARCFRAMNRPH